MRFKSLGTSGQNCNSASVSVAILMHSGYPSEQIPLVSETRSHRDEYFTRIQNYNMPHLHPKPKTSRNF